MPRRKATTSSSASSKKEEEAKQSSPQTQLTRSRKVPAWVRDAAKLWDRITLEEVARLRTVVTMGLLASLGSEESQGGGKKRWPKIDVRTAQVLLNALDALNADVMNTKVEERLKELEQKFAEMADREGAGTAVSPSEADWLGDKG